MRRLERTTIAAGPAGRQAVGRITSMKALTEKIAWPMPGGP
jgi:hypothetical protein